MKAKPIEPGCLALVLKSKHGHAGNVVTVIEKITMQNLEWDQCIENVGLWRLDVPYPKGGHYCAREENLMRIDDPDIQREIESERELEVTK